jgi:hypothetical protein
MANPLVEHARRTNPAGTKGLSDADVTLQVASELRARGDLDQYRQKYPDFDRDLLDSTNSGGDIPAETWTALKADVLDRAPGVLESAGALGADALARESLMAEIGLSEPLQQAGDFLRGKAEANRRSAEQRIAEGGGRTISRIEDIRPGSPRDYLLWALPTVSGNLSSLGMSLGTGVATGLITKNPAAALAAAGAGSIVQNAGDIYGSLNEDPNVNRGRAIDAGLVGGLASGLLDVLPEIAPLAKLFPGAEKAAIAKWVGSVAGRGGFGGAAKGAMVQAGSEFGTEGLQELVAIASEEYATGKQATPEEIRSRVLNAAAAGAAMGLPSGAITGAIPEQKAPVVPPAAPSANATLVPPAGTPEDPMAPFVPPNPPSFAVPGGARPEILPVPWDAQQFAPLVPNADAGLGEVVEPTGASPVDASLLPTEAPVLTPDQIAGLAGKPVKLMAEENGQPTEVEIDAGEAWTDTAQRLSIYEKLQACLVA